MERGLLFAGFDRRRQRVRRETNLDRFRSAYGSNPVVLARIWEDLQKTTVPEAKISREATKHFDRFLMAFYFLNVYPTEKREAGIFKVDEKTGRKWRWYFVEKIRALKKQKIVWPEEWEDDDAPIFIYSVDGTHCNVNEPKHPTMSKNPKYYSHKNKKPALTYELALSLWEARLVWINGPEKASVHDITVFCSRDGLKEKTPQGKRGIGDLGYRGEKGIISTPNSHDPEDLRKFKSRARSRQETFNARIKFHACLDVRFRHSLEKHEIVFEACCVIVQYQMENGSPVFDI